MKRQRFYIAVFVSAILHLAVFTFWWHSHDAVVVSSLTHGSPLTISISQPTPLAATQPKPSIPKSSIQKTKKTAPPAQQPEILSMVHASPVKTATPQHESEPTAKTPLARKSESDRQNEHPVHDQQQDFALINNHMIDYLSTEFKLRFKYPGLARKRGWQGEVLLWLEINRHGEISSIAVKRSSGYKILDRNAVKTFELIGMISPKLTTGLKATLETKLAREHHLSIPVIYKLTGG